MSDWISAFVFFFTVIDPVVGTLPVFIAVTAVHSDRQKRRIAIIPVLLPSIASPGANIVSRVMGLILASLATLPVPAHPPNASLLY